ncbi:MAG: AAA family ATPase [Solirubrobacteraceae bacterium]|nr:AAA family ATPase [Solirubrobacteraceae bacterium]
MFDWTVTRGLVRRGHDQPLYESRRPVPALAGAAELDVEAIFVFRDLRSHLGEAETSRALRDLLATLERSHRVSTVVVLGSRPELPAELHDLVVTLPLGLPTEVEYRTTLTAVADSLAAGGRATVTLTPDDYAHLTGALRGLTLNQARQALARVAIEDGHLNRDDLPRLVDLKAQALQQDGLLEYFPAADNAAALGGFARLRTWLDRAKVGFSAEAREMNLPAPKGVLLVGVQGCGKSLAAKSIARAWQMPLLKLDAGRLYDKYVGETERNLRRALAVAESLAPSVLWIDEIEKALASGSGDASDGGLSKRMLGTLLTWMAERQSEVFLVATANDVFSLPPELLRKGRFDEIFFVDLPTASERKEILAIHLRMRRQDPAGLDLGALVAQTDGFSGAELEQIVVGALLGALQAGQALDVSALTREAAATVPLSRSRAEDVQRLRALATERFVPVA